MNSHMETPMNTKVLLIALLLTLAGCGSESASQKPPVSAEHPAEGDEHEEGGEHNEESGEGHVALTDEQVKTAGIGLEQAGPAAIRETLPVYGTIAPNAERVRDVGARFPGIIRNVSKKIGDEVRQGETLATVESKMFQGLLSRLYLATEADGQPIRFYADLPSREVTALEPGATLRVFIEAEHVRIFPVDD